jgi:hypothetical protein
MKVSQLMLFGIFFGISSIEARKNEFNARRSHTFGLGQKQRSFFGKVDTKKMNCSL